MLDFRSNTFLEACECLNFTRTAERLHITQPAVTQHIHFLEEYYETKLFACEGKKIRLTEEGEALRRMLSSQRNDTAYLKKKLATLKTDKRSLRFGVSLTIGEFVIARPLAGLLQKNPELSVHIETANTRELLRKIKQGELEFAIMEGNFPGEAFDSRICSRERFIAVCASDYRPKKEVREVKDLLSERLIIREEGSGTRELLLKDLERRNMTPEDFAGVIEIGTMSAIKALVSLGCGVSFLYEAAVRRELKEGSLRKLVPEDFSLVHDFSFVWQRGSLFARDYLKILDELELTAGEYGESDIMEGGRTKRKGPSEQVNSKEGLKCGFDG